MNQAVVKLTLSVALLALGFLAAQATTASSQWQGDGNAPNVQDLLADCAMHFVKVDGSPTAYTCEFRFYPRCRDGFDPDVAKIIWDGKHWVISYPCRDNPP